MHSMEDGLEAWSLLRLLHITRQIVCMAAAVLQSCRGEMFGSEAAVAVLGNLYNVN
jgi:hypothetical protein